MTHKIIEEVAAEMGLNVWEVTAHAATRSTRGARYKAAYRLVTETDLTIGEIADLLGYSQWSGVNYAVSMHARSVGIEVATTTELRHGLPARAIAWKRLGDHLRQNYLAKDYRRAGVSRMVWMALMRGKRVNADDFLIAIKRLGLTVEQFATDEFLNMRATD